MESIASNIIDLKAQLPEQVRLVAVSKTKPLEDIMEAYNTGHRIFGENRVQEIVMKHPLLPDDIEWHMIGHLQRNKVKLISKLVSMIHSVDSYRLIETINVEALKINRVINCLLQIHIAEEESKFGLNFAEAKDLVKLCRENNFNNICIRGVMGMATFTDDMVQVRSEFKNLKKIFDKLRSGLFAGDKRFSEISMGMSGDYKIAIEEGSNIVRIGSLVFGDR